AVGTVVPIVAHATDPDGPTPTITYQQVIHHCPVPGSCHLHPSGAQTGPQGSYTCVIPDHGDDSYLEVIITAVDAGGATATASVAVPARKRSLQVSSSPAGVPIVVNATNSTAAPALAEIVGSQNHVIAPSSYGNLVFDHWSDGQSRDHVFTMPDAEVNLVAVYRIAPVAPVPPPTAGGWTLNGAAALQGDALVLTPAAVEQRGTAWWPTAVPTEGLRVSFDATIAPGHGADGMTFAMTDPSVGADALGDGGAGLGFGELPGVAVALDTFQGPNDPSANFVGLAAGAAEGQLLYAATNAAVPDLGGTHHVDIEVVGGHAKVTVDGQPALDKALTLPNMAQLGFTAATGGLSDRHSVTNVQIQPPAPSLTVSPQRVDFGSVAPGASVTRTFTVANAGTAPLSLQGVTTGGGPFVVTTAPAAGTVIAAGQSVSVAVGFAPSSPGAWTGTATVATSAGDATVVLSGGAGAGTAGPAVDGTFTPVEPYRLFDTRPSGRLRAGRELAIDLNGQPGAPTHPTAVMMNVTVTAPAADGFVRAYPCGTSPYVSSVNFDAGQTAANLAVVRVPADGRVCFWSMVDTDIVVDVGGWFATGDGNTYRTVEPVRVLDTRQTTRLTAGEERPFTLAGRSAFPTGARAALLNLTVTGPADAGYLRVYPCGHEQTVSNVNFAPGQTVANLAAVMVAPGGQVCFRASADTDLVVDLAGWYAPGAGAEFAAPDPVRLVDTRTSTGALQPGAALAITVAGQAGIPAEATSVVLNITAAGPDGAGYVRAYPCGTDPLVSNVNYRDGQVAAANLAVVEVPADGRVCLSSFTATDLVVDLAGWYTG
ncbi:MAG TPA: choice-of-anchor D domain-containing protein, partial [Acidimicrobiales bacterium]